MKTCSRTISFFRLGSSFPCRSASDAPGRGGGGLQPPQVRHVQPQPQEHVQARHDRFTGRGQVEGVAFPHFFIDRCCLSLFVWR